MVWLSFFFFLLQNSHTMETGIRTWSVFRDMNQSPIFHTHAVSLESFSLLKSYLCTLSGSCTVPLWHGEHLDTL